MSGPFQPKRKPTSQNAAAQITKKAPKDTSVHGFQVPPLKQFRVLSLGFWVLGFESWALGFGSWVLGFGFWVFGFRVWVLGSGFWVLGFGGGPSGGNVTMGSSTTPTATNPKSQKTARKPSSKPGLGLTYLGSTLNPKP